MDRTDAARSLKESFGFTDECTGCFDSSYLISFERYLRQLKDDPAATFSVVGENRQFTVHKFDPSMARRDMERPRARRLPLPRLTRMIADDGSPGFMIVFSERREERAGGGSSASPVSSGQPAGFIWQGSGPFFSAEEKDGGTAITFCHSNISFHTLARNAFETFTAYGIFPFFTEIRESAGVKKGDRNILKCRFVFKTALDRETLAAVESDFRRYLDADLRFMSIFDIIGPSMVGPSSSHTAGACRIGQISRSVFCALKKGGAYDCLDSLSVKLLGSFRDTGAGHRTPSAIAGGLWGFRPDDEQLMRFGDPAFLESNPVEIAGCKASFRGFFKGSPDDDKKYERERSANIAEITAHTDRGEFTVAGFSLGGGNVEVRYLNGARFSVPLTGKEELSLRYLLGESYPDSVVDRVTPGAAPPPGGAERPEFNTFEEVAEHCAGTGKSLVETAMETEAALNGTRAKEIFSEMLRCWRIMREGVGKGLEDKRLSMLGLTGGDSAKMSAYIEKNRSFDNLFGRAVAYATAVSEINAKSCVIVAAPTAGSCGVIPGVLKAYEEIAGTPERKILEALVIAGFFGMILFDDVSTAGADYGCQAEIGAAAAMAAAAAAHIEGGTPPQVIQSFALAMKNCMGLVCDPVAGLVEVPCVKRNGIYASVALSSAMMAMSGVVSFVSPDEVILAVREVGERLHRDYKETAGGGLAKTRDGQRAAVAFRKEAGRFFKE